MMECDCCFGVEDPDEPDSELIPGDMIGVDGVICIGCADRIERRLCEAVEE